MISKRKYVTLSIKKKIELIKGLEAGYTVSCFIRKIQSGEINDLYHLKKKTRRVFYSTPPHPAL